MVFACRYCSESYEAEVAQGTSLGLSHDIGDTGVERIVSETAGTETASYQTSGAPRSS